MTVRTTKKCGCLFPATAPRAPTYSIRESCSGRLNKRNSDTVIGESNVETNGGWNSCRGACRHGTTGSGRRAAAGTAGRRARTPRGRWNDGGQRRLSDRRSVEELEGGAGACLESEGSRGQ